MIGTRSSKVEIWKDMEFLGLLNYPCQMLIYFYNRRFDAKETIIKLIRIDKYYMSRTEDYALSSLFFLVSNHAYAKSIGFVVASHEIEKGQIAMHVLAKDFSILDINNSFQILKNALTQLFLFQVYGFEDLQSIPKLFRFDQNIKNPMQWFEEVFMYFLSNRTLLSSNNLDLLLKDLDCCYCLPYRLIELYYLAQIFNQCYYVEATSFVNIFQLLQQVFPFFFAISFCLFIKSTYYCRDQMQVPLQ